MIIAKVYIGLCMIVFYAVVMTSKLYHGMGTCFYLPEVKHQYLTTKSRAWRETVVTKNLL